ncbi:Zn(2)-C6 fungal-type domain-containing protein [Mycena sanguinolenta]|uniref:Zn(2)-C6 fungal-type domain-containing protein n=1 Tax=Mycena sanguinolenta TaxID=230812 RepID=A0A8H6X638_9AGAR|nr:Zn(2)-C6 fungal-type domain-containing protein [Mycena sanguinolenta]
MSCQNVNLIYIAVLELIKFSGSDNYAGISFTKDEVLKALKLKSSSSSSDNVAFDPDNLKDWSKAKTWYASGGVTHNDLFRKVKTVDFKNGLAERRAQHGKGSSSSKGRTCRPSRSSSGSDAPSRKHRRSNMKVHVPPATSTSLVVSSQQLSLAVATPLQTGSALASNVLELNCPSLDPEFVAHCFDCFEYLPQINHALVKRTGIKDSIRAAAFDLHHLRPQSRVLALCIIAFASLSSFHESVLGPGPRPQSMEDLDFFLSSPDIRECGMRRAAACRALRAKAVKDAFETGIMFEATEENALSCYLLDNLDQSDTCGPTRIWGAAYIAHVRAMAPRWREGKYTQSDEARWMGLLMAESLFATARRIPMLTFVLSFGAFGLLTRRDSTLHDQRLLSGPESSLESLLESIESKKQPGLQVLWSSMKPYFFHAVCLARQLYLEINGDYPRLNPLSEVAVIKFLSSLTLLHSVVSLLLARVNSAIGPPPHTRTPIRDGDLCVDSAARSCGYSLVIGFISLALPFHHELELRCDIEDDPRFRERMQLFRMQARKMAASGLHELACALRYLPPLHYMPVNWHILYPCAEFCVEAAAENKEDLEMIVKELKIMGYSLDVFSSPQVTQLIERLEVYLRKPTPAFGEDFLNSAELADLFLPLEQPWMGSPKGTFFDGMQDESGSDFPFSEFANE